ncbi:MULTISPECIES: FadR/GntR family transcriptional regulator [Sphingobacterium]|uniref:FadR/GntR family transcriptional regulator n=1 Tax=Sphingobacterium TaxID=28453 RepID=UPI000C0C094E|nr:MULTISPECIES: GntR family transcriptional regulator [Sphingobacterium]MCT1532875.1 GntR family transcriptional regulator [Sphingobacterium daejeonense]
MSAKISSMGFKPIETTSLTDLVEVKLRDYLQEKKLIAGDSLPTEMEIAEALGVSRNILREALSRLRMLGIITSKKKRGMILTHPDVLGSLEKVLQPQLVDKNTLHDIFELRLVLELGMADLLFLRIEEKHLEELDKIVKNDDPTNVNFRIKNEIAFHGKLYEITGNETLKRFQSMLMPLFDYVLKTEKRVVTPEVSHADLVELIRKGNKSDFKKGMEEHLRPHLETLSKLK